MSYRITVDTGGTFTDVTIVTPDGRMLIGKALTTSDRMWTGISVALSTLADELELETDQLLADASLFVWGTTRGTNAIIEGTTARTGFLTTEGFPDTLVLREGGKRDPFNLRMRYPEPYVPRELTFEISERVGPDGEILRPLDEGRTLAALAELASLGIEAIGVCLLWSIRNHAHELRVGELIEEALPGVPYTLSHRLNPVLREYRRASAAVIDASLKPLMQAHVREMEADLRADGFRGELLLLTCLGGAMTIEDLLERPVLTVNSGPSMAPVAARVAARASANSGDVIVCDMGGTSFDIALVQGGEIKRTQDTWIGPALTGHLTGFPAVDVKSVGAGGGSIAWVDGGGLLHVGPESARSEPGPACYGRGGTRPTVTDAAVCLGYIDPERFLGGRLRLDAEAAAEALRRAVAIPLGLDLERAAHAVMALSNENVLGALVEITVRAGVDPREHVIVAGGGACGLTIAAIAADLGCRRIVIPKAASTMSAAGAQFADIVAETVVSRFANGEAFPFADVGEVLEHVEGDLDRFAANLRSSWVERVSKAISVDARYPSQVWEIEVPVAAGRIHDAADLAELSRRFHAAHERLYGVSDPSQPLEFVQWRGRLTARLPTPTLAVDRPVDGELAATTTASAYFGGLGRVPTDRYRAERMVVGSRVAGPAVVEEPLTTIVVPPDWVLTVTQAGDYLMELGA